jgi:hypothetical protein
MKILALELKDKLKVLTHNNETKNPPPPLLLCCITQNYFVPDTQNVLRILLALIHNTDIF